MRTRIFNKMLASEVEEYLARGGNTMFIGIGVVEVHGGMPIDIEQILPEAQALALAEEYDGLCMINHPYLFPGGTTVSPATVHMTVRDSIDYMMNIYRSLVAQGFRKIYCLYCHGPAKLFLDAAQRDFFQESKICVLNLNPRGITKNYKKPNGEAYGREILSAMTYGAYKMLHQEDYLPVDPNGKGIDPELARLDPRLERLTKLNQACGSSTCTVYSRPEQHIGLDAPFKSIEERDEVCARGEKYIRETMKLVPIPELSEALDEYYEYLEEVFESHPRLRGLY